MSIGGKLYELRKEKGLSQEEVADKLNVSRQTVSKWETDQSMPEFDKIVPICELYSITADELLMGIKKEEKNAENVSDDSILEEKNKKRALGIGIGILLYFVAVVWVMITIPVMLMNPVVSSGIFLLICGVATFIIIYTSIVYKKEEKKVEMVEIKSSSKMLARQINNIISIIFTVIYLTISFITMAWHITWILWIVYACIAEIVKLLFMLRGDYNEK